MINFTYGGIRSDSFKIYCDRETHSILPEKQRYVKEIPNLDGVVDMGIGGYGVRVISLPLIFNGDFEDLRADREKIIAWLSNNGQPKKLEFDDEPNKYYLAKVYSAMDFQNNRECDLGVVQFECNPPWAYLNNILQTPEMITWDFYDSLEERQLKKEITTPVCYIRFHNTGSLAIKPIIKLIGKISNYVILTHNGKDFKYNTFMRYDGLEIDCKNETVKLMSNGSNVFSYVPTGSDNFPIFLSGKNEIKIQLPNAGIDKDSLTILIDIEPQVMG